MTVKLRKGVVRKGVAGSVLAAVLMTQTAFAAPHTPARGSRERVAIMNAVRPQLGDGRHKPVITAYHLKVERGWAFIMGGFSYSDGSKPGGEFAEGSGTNFTALLRREKGRWRVKRFTYNGDDQAPEFAAAFPQAPRAIFRYSS